MCSLPQHTLRKSESPVARATFIQTVQLGPSDSVLGLNPSSCTGGDASSVRRQPSLESSSRSSFFAGHRPIVHCDSKPHARDSGTGARLFPSDLRPSRTRIPATQLPTPVHMTAEFGHSTDGALHILRITLSGMAGKMCGKVRHGRRAGLVRTNTCRVNANLASGRALSAVT